MWEFIINEFYICGFEIGNMSKLTQAEFISLAYNKKMNSLTSLSYLYVFSSRFNKQYKMFSHDLAFSFNFHVLLFE